nr:MAG TPA: hypothetical protein [Caudoviricetes sp.]
MIIVLYLVILFYFILLALLACRDIRKQQPNENINPILVSQYPPPTLDKEQTAEYLRKNYLIWWYYVRCKTFTECLVKNY